MAHHMGNHMIIITITIIITILILYIYISKYIKKGILNMGVKIGDKIEGTRRLFVMENEWGKSYSLGVSSKDPEGNWIPAYQPIRFKKDMTPPPNKTLIHYIAFTTSKKGKERNKVIWQITSFDVVEEGLPETFADPSGFTALDSEDIPF